MAYYKDIRVKLLCPKSRSFYSCSIMAEEKDGEIRYLPFGCANNNEGESCAKCVSYLFHYLNDNKIDLHEGQIIEIQPSVPKKS